MRATWILKTNVHPDKALSTYLSLRTLFQKRGSEGCNDDLPALLGPKWRLCLPQARIRQEIDSLPGVTWYLTHLLSEYQKFERFCQSDTWLVEYTRSFHYLIKSMSISIR